MQEKQFVKELADINTDFAQWYTDIVKKAELMDYGPVKGTMVIRPYGYAIWENIQNLLDKRFKADGVQNAYFPMFIPENFFTREKQHVEGFAPEVAVVTYAGGAELSEKLIIRPTSETIICDMFSKWIKSYRDLPLKVNQWCNVCRWEKTTRPFLRTSEFLWQEGHSVHSTLEEASKQTQNMLECYKDLSYNDLAIPMFIGKKSEREKFAGAFETYTIEAMMHDGKSLQSGTSHNLGQNFAKAFNIKFLNNNGRLDYGYSTSWGVSTRLLGAIIMVHGDERGLVLPPRIAPIQVVIVPIASNKPGVNEKCSELYEKLKAKGLRVKFDNSNNTPGYKFNNWEMKGVPIRIEMGPRDIEQGNVQLFRRDTLEKSTIPYEDIENIESILNDIQENMLKKALERRNSRIKEVNTISDMVTEVEKGNFVIMPHCGEIDCENNIKDETTITCRCIHSYDVEGLKCPNCGKKAIYKAYFAKSY